MKKYVVGGAVRDVLIADSMQSEYITLPLVKDIDYVVTDCTHQQMNDLYGETIGKDFPVWLDSECNEVALARIERSTGNKTTDFTFNTENVTIEDDLGRRDLTINAMAVLSHKYNALLDIQDIVDPYNGLSDVKNKILRHTTDAFKEDPLRVLRVARFYARYYDYGFTVADETKELCAEMIADKMLDNLPKERVWLETMKALSEKNAHMYFAFLSDIGFCSVPSTRELMNLKHYTTSPLHTSEQSLMAKWAAFDHRNRYTRQFGATKRFDRTSEILLMLNSLNAFDSSCIDALKMLGAYKEGGEFKIALSQVSDEVKRKVIEDIVDATRNVVVDVEPGPEYGLAQMRKRRLIADELLRCL